ncbi:helix-turn-helix domain-containing protein [Peribacillus loiseleuriae]|uniref:helix-turn-helix domain-containing protein n=1 Tax=Peribacillus loiseleuriae TaxID=1679170 RepID=UPI003818C796
MSNLTPKILENLRERKGWSKTEVARRLGMKTVSTYANWEYGIRTPDKDMLAKLAELYDTSTDYLITGINKNSISTSKDNEIDSLKEINEMIKEFGIEGFGFFDIEKWRNLSAEDLDELRRHFEWVAQKAKERNEEKK